MKLTDLFVKRPVLAIVVNLVILIAGLQAVRSLSVRQYPRSDSAVVKVTTVYVGRQRGPGARLHHHAARAGHRQRRRHRLHGVVERPGGLDDHRPPPAQLRHQRRPDPGPGQGRPGEERPAARGGGTGHPARDGGRPVRRHVHRLLLGRPGPERDLGLPHSGGPAEALGGQRRPARRHPGRPHLRHARLAQAGQDGRPRHLAVRGAPGPGPEQLPVGPGPDQGLHGVGQPGRQHRPPDPRGVPAARGQGEGRRGGPPGRDRRRGPGRGEL